MKKKLYTVNKTGIQEIKKFLEENHKFDGIFDEGMLYAWAEDAEDAINREDRLPEIEIKARHSKSGKDVSYCISDEGIDCEEIKVDDV